MMWDAILIDLDGTLVDTEAQHDAALTRACREVGNFFQQFHADQYTGRSIVRLHAYAAERGQSLPGDLALDDLVGQIRARKWIELEELLGELESEDLDPRGKSRTAWNRLAALDLPVRIVTDTPRVCAERICTVLGWPTDALVTRDEVGGLEKPDPAIYTLARNTLEALHPVALEDSLRGAHAASAAHIPSYLVHGPEGVIAWLTLEFPTPAAFMTTAARKTKSRTRRPASRRRRKKARS